MGSLLSYSIASSLVLTALYLPYKWLLSGEKMPWQNRLTLLSVYFIALLAVPVAGHIGAVSDTALGTVDVAGLVPVSVDAGDGSGEGLSLWNVLLCIYLGGIAVMLFCAAVIMVRLRSVLSETVPVDVDGTEVSVSPDNTLAPFSIGNRIVVSEEDLQSPCLPLVVAHERVHVRLCHWADLALGYAVCLLQWYNPVSWLMLRELRAVHEYQADAGAIASGANIKDYQMLLIKKAVGYRFQSFANSLNHSNLKTRITMMYSSSTRGLRRWRALALVPALGTALFVTDLSAVASVLTEASEAVIPAPAATAGKVSENPAPVQATEADDPLRTVEQMPKYPGGEKAMLECLARNIVYPESAKNENKQGNVVVQFVVGKDGKVRSPKIIRSVSPALDQAAVDAIMKLEAFSPGLVDGKPVSVYYTLPVSFKLAADDKKK